MSPPLIGLSAFTLIVSGALIGWYGGTRLPPHHATTETKAVVTVSMAVVGTISALVLGLLVSNANGSFNQRAAEVTGISADIVRLDRLMSRYGPETDPIRGTLRRYAERKLNDLFPDTPQPRVRINDRATDADLEEMQDQLQALRPADSRRQWLQMQALQLATDIGAERWLLVEQDRPGTPPAFLILVMFWLALLFASFALFAPRNLTVGICLVLCALAVSGGVEMVLELEQPFSGLVKISSVPLREAVAVLAK